MQDLDALFRPRAVAVVGAGRSPQSIGYQLVANLLEFGYTGAILPVNPKADEVLGQRCYHSIEALPGPVDLAILALPAHLVLGSVEACHAKGIRGIVTITAGFRESGEHGARLEQQLRERLRELGVKMVGPNCMGLLNTADDVRLNATFAFTQPLPGDVAFASQSGSLGEAILSHARSLGLGLSEFVSLGNATDVTSEDMVARWAEDPHTRVILLYLETLADAHGFMERALAATRGRRKPILAVKSGRTRAGARAASSHTGALAGRDQLTNALFERCGIVRVDEIYDLFAVATAFSSQPLPAGPRLGILTNAGGPAIQAADATDGTGLAMATLGDETTAALESALPAGASLVNPVDMLATAQGETFGRCAEAMLADPDVDALLVIYVTPIILDTPDVAARIVEGLQRGAEAAARPKPVLACVMGRAHEDPGAEVLKKAGYPVYPFPERAIQALAAMNRHARWLDEPEGEVPYYADVDAERVWGLLDGRAAGWLDTGTALQVLRAYGIPVVPSRRVTTADEAVRFAEGRGWPVALKVDSEEILHKTDVGGVKLDLRYADEVEAAVAEVTESVGRAPAFRVQPMVQGGCETIVGVTLDPVFGHVVMFGLGGIAVEVLGDVRFEMLPMTPDKARRMVDGIRGVQLLRGFRGRPPVDIDQLIDVLVRVGRLVADHPRIQEIDLNPFIAHADRTAAGVVDVRIRIGDGI